MAETQIEWTDSTWNPVAGCSIVTAGCTHCYAMEMAKRLEAMGIDKYAGLTRKTGNRTVWNGVVREDREALAIPHRWLKPRKIFVNSMSDLFHEQVSDAFILAVWQVMRDTPRHNHQILTKRPGDNPGGWRYWLIHFANAYRARQVYNNILHDNASLQAHVGRSGLNMLSYDPRHDEGTLYLFDDSGRASAKSQLLNDIPRLLNEAGDAIPVIECYESIYNVTPVHADDVHAAIIENPDLEVITRAGGERRKAHTIVVTDVIKLKNQRSSFPTFFDSGKN